MKNNEKIHAVLKDIFNGNYRFCSHNDIGINRLVGWHKDKLNCEVSKYETHDIWKEFNGVKHEIVKVLIYLEDHSNDNDGLKLVPKSHVIKQIKTENHIQLKPSIGDIIIFDQRITHRGMVKRVPHPRILVSFGFGKNNIFTDNFEKGTIIRQNKQNNTLNKYNNTLNKYNIPYNLKKPQWVIDHFKYLNEKDKTLTEYQKKCSSELTHICKKYENYTDKGPTGPYYIKHNYTEIYGDLLRYYKNRKNNILEIGIRQGGFSKNVEGIFQKIHNLWDRYNIESSYS